MRYHDNGARTPDPVWEGIESKHIALRFAQLIAVWELKWTMQGKCILCRKKRAKKSDYDIYGIIAMLYLWLECRRQKITNNFKDSTPWGNLRIVCFFFLWTT